MSHIDSEAVEVGITSTTRPARSNPMNMPLSGNGCRSAVPVLIESGSFSKFSSLFLQLNFHLNIILYMQVATSKVLD